MRPVSTHFFLLDDHFHFDARAMYTVATKEVGQVSSQITCSHLKLILLI